MLEEITMEPVKLLSGSKFDQFDDSVEKKFDSNIEFGLHGIDLTRHIRFNTEDNTIPRYFKGPLLKNLNGQYHLIEVPDAAISPSFTVEHDLKRTPSGILIVQQAGVNNAILTTLPFTLQDIFYGLITYPSDATTWNKTTITLKAVRLYGTGYPQRMLTILL